MGRLLSLWRRNLEQCLSNLAVQRNQLRLFVKILIIIPHHLPVQSDSHGWDPGISSFRNTPGVWSVQPRFVSPGLEEGALQVWRLRLPNGVIADCMSSVFLFCLPLSVGPLDVFPFTISSCLHLFKPHLLSKHCSKLGKRQESPYLPFVFLNLKKIFLEASQKMPSHIFF